jgi:hypothetical protein
MAVDRKPFSWGGEIGQPLLLLRKRFYSLTPRVKYKKGTFVTVPNRDRIRGLPANAQVVYLWLCSYADEDGTCYPSRTTLARDTRISVRSVDAAIRLLEERGILERTERKDPLNRMRNLSNYYQIMILEDVNPVQVVQGGGAGAARGVVQELRRELNPVLTKPKEYRAAAAAISFEVVEDEPKKARPTKDTSALKLRESLYDLFDRETGCRPTPTTADYVRVVAARKILSDKDIASLVEDALQGRKPPITLHEALSTRSIDSFRRNNQ